MALATPGLSLAWLVPQIHGEGRQGGFLRSKDRWDRAAMAPVMSSSRTMRARNHAYVHTDSKATERERDEGDEDCVDDEECAA